MEHTNCSLNQINTALTIRNKVTPMGSRATENRRMVHKANKYMQLYFN